MPRLPVRRPRCDGGPLQRRRRKGCSRTTGTRVTEALRPGRCVPRGRRVRRRSRLRSPTSGHVRALARRCCHRRGTPRAQETGRPARAHLRARSRPCPKTASPDPLRSGADLCTPASRPECPARGRVGPRARRADRRRGARARGPALCRMGCVRPGSPCRCRRRTRATRERRVEAWVETNNLSRLLRSGRAAGCQACAERGFGAKPRGIRLMDGLAAR